MFAAVLFLFVALGVGIGVLWFYSGPKSEEIKGLLKKIFGNLKDFFSNLKNLLALILDLIQSEPEEDSKESLSTAINEVAAKEVSDTISESDSSSQNQASEVKTTISVSEVKPINDFHETSKNIKDNQSSDLASAESINLANDQDKVA